MVQKLSEPLEEQVRQYVVDSIRPSEIEGYDPTTTHPSSDTFLPVTNDWSNYGDTYPVIVVQETDGPVVPNSGNTNSNGLQGDGSGRNQFSVYPVTISVQTIEDETYRNNVAYDNLVHTIYQEVKFQFKDVDAITEALYCGELTPPTQTRDSSETDSGSTQSWIQHQGTVSIGVQYEP